MDLSRRAYGAGLCALILPVLYTRPLITGFWSGRYLALLVIAAIGLVVLLWNLPHREAQLALAFVAASALSAALSPTPVLAMFGDFGLGTGLLFVAAVAGAWAIGGVAAGGDGRTVFLFGTVAAALANVAIAVGETLFDLSEVGFSGSPGRASGLLGNPVFLGGYLAAVGWMIVVDLLDRARPWAYAVVGAAALGVQLSGSRIALLLLLVACGTALIRRWRVGLVVAAVVFAGSLAGAGIAETSGANAGTTRVAETVTSGGSSGQARLDVWSSSRHAVARRPVFGAGPGRFGVATSPDRTLPLVKNEGAERYFYDAHNIVVEYGVTTGILGLAILLAWLVALGRHAKPVSDPSAAFGVALFVSHLVQPQNVVLTPLMFLALGIAGRPLRTPPGAPVAVAAAVVTAPVATLGFGMFALDQARLDFEPARAAQADRYLPPWPQPTEQAARVLVLQSREQLRPELELQALDARARAAAENPGDARVLKTLAQHQGELGKAKEQLRTLDALLEADPWSPTALNGLGLAASERGNARGDQARRAVAYFRRSLLVDPSQDSIRRLMVSLERQI